MATTIIADKQRDELSSTPCEEPKAKEEFSHLDELEQLNLIHKEIHNEHGLISNRMNWYVTSQSFLMIAFTNAGGAGFRFWWLSAGFIPIVGILLSLIIWRSENAAQSAMEILRKEEFSLLGEQPLSVLPFGRMPLWIHQSGMFPSKFIPILFIFAWFLAWILALLTLSQAI